MKQELRLEHCMIVVFMSKDAFRQIVGYSYKNNIPYTFINNKINSRVMYKNSSY